MDLKRLEELKDGLSMEQPIDYELQYDTMIELIEIIIEHRKEINDLYGRLGHIAK